LKKGLTEPLFRGDTKPGEEKGRAHTYKPGRNGGLRVLLSAAKVPSVNRHSL